MEKSKKMAKIKLSKDEVEIIELYEEDFQTASAAFRHASLLLKHNSNRIWEKINAWYPETKNKTASYDWGHGIVKYDPDSNTKEIKKEV